MKPSSEDRRLARLQLPRSGLATPAPVRRLSVLGVALLQVALLGACATITGDPTQVVHVETLDEQGQPIEGMRCHLSNSSSEYFGDSPMFGLEVHRSASDLKIACRLGDRIAEGTAVSRSGLRGGITGVANLVLPGGSAYMVIDHLTGYRYAYPTWVRVQIGRQLVFDAGDEVDGKPVPALHQEPETPAPSRMPAIERGLARSDGGHTSPAAAPTAGGWTTDPKRVLVRSD
jgi:hypothetical protein